MELKPGARSFFWVSHMTGRRPNTNSILVCCPGSFARSLFGTATAELASNIILCQRVFTYSITTQSAGILFPTDVQKTILIFYVENMNFLSSSCIKLLFLKIPFPSPIARATTQILHCFFLFKIYLFLLESQIYTEEERHRGKSSI